MRKIILFTILIIFISGFVNAVTIFNNVTECTQLQNNSVYNIAPNFQVTNNFCFYSESSLNVTIDCNGNEIDLNSYAFIIYPYNIGSEPNTNFGEVYYKLQNCTFINYDNNLDASDTQVFLLYNSTSNVSLYIENNNFNGVTVGLYSQIKYLELENNNNLTLQIYDVSGILNSGYVNSSLIKNNVFSSYTSFLRRLDNSLIIDNIFLGEIYGWRIYNTILYNNNFYNRLYTTSRFENSSIERNIFNDINQQDINIPFGRTTRIFNNTFIKADLIMYGSSGFRAGNYNVSYNTFINSGIYQEYSDNSKIMHNTFTNPQQGVPFYWGAAGNIGTIISNNIFTNIGDQNCWGDCSGNNSEYVELNYNNWRAIEIMYCTNCIFEDNYIENITAGFRVRLSTTGNIIRNNIIKNVGNGGGVQLRDGANYNYVYNNYITNTEKQIGYVPFGIILRNVNNNNVYDNIVSGNFFRGIIISNTANNNLLYNNYINISLSEYYYNTFLNNPLYSSNGGSALIVFSDSNNNIIRDSIFEGNNEYTVKIIDTLSDTNTIINNKIYNSKIFANGTDTKWFYNNLTNVNATSYILNSWKCNNLFSSLLVGGNSTCGSNTGNPTKITTQGTVTEDNVVIIVNGDTSNETEFIGEKTIIIAETNEPIVEFNYIFGTENLNTSKISLQKNTVFINSTFIKDYVIVDMGGLTETKTLYLRNNNLYFVCAKDEIINSVDDISLNCNESNEYLFTGCLGGSLTIDHITCTDLGKWLKFTGLNNSGILGLSEEELAVIQESCGNVKQNIYTAFTLLALVSVVIAGFILLKIFSGDIGTLEIISSLLLLIGLTLVLFIGYVVISAVSASIC